MSTSNICFECADVIFKDGSSCTMDKVGYQISFESPYIVIDFAHQLSKTVAFDSFTAKARLQLKDVSLIDGATTGCLSLEIHPLCGE